MLNLAKRPAKIGVAINSRRELHGETPVTALDIPLTDIMLDASELNAILREPHAHNVLFNESGVATGGRIREPVFKHISALSLADKIEGATVTIVHGVEAVELRLSPVKLSKVKLQPQVGGLTAMTCTVQCTPDLNAGIAALLERLDSVVDVEIDCGDFGKQQSLPLGAQADKPKGRGRGKNKPADPPATVIAATGGSAGATH